VAAFGREKKVCIVLVNYNGSEDTIACLESLRDLEYQNRQVLIVDNSSTDDSVARLKAWLSAACDPTELRQKGDTSGAGDSSESRIWAFAAKGRDAGDQHWPYVLIENQRNSGFAGGNNSAIRFALARQDGDYFWLLNNDTVVDPRALDELVATFEAEDASTNPTGMCGSLILDFGDRDTIQAYGGAEIARFLGTTRNCLKGRPATSIISNRNDAIPDYLSGCSLLIPRAVIDRIGLLDESYFLYWEDAEWSFRCKRHGLSLAVAAGSKVWHRRGSTSRRYPIVGYYNTRNSLRFFRQYLPGYLVFCILVKPVFVSAVCLKHRDLAFFRESMRGYIEFFREWLGKTA
jgi:GT2 family glycosyltransferase